MPILQSILFFSHGFPLCIFAALANMDTSEPMRAAPERL